MVQLSEIDSELINLHDFCTQNGIAGLDLKSLVKPLTDFVDTKRRKQWSIATAKRLIIVVCIGMLFRITDIQKEIYYWQRITFISLLPLWDWTQLYDESCLVKNPSYLPPVLQESDCHACRKLSGVEKLTNMSHADMISYFREDVPVVISDGADDWFVMRTDEFWFENITEMYGEDDTISYPCSFTTNLKPHEPSLESFFEEIYQESVEPWFAHWENCDKAQTKIIRKFYQRPYFVPPPVDLGAPNWVLVSSQYRTPNYREVSIPYGFVIVAQIRGYNHFRLVPREPCFLLCPGLEITLDESELLSFTTGMWQLEYRPGEDADNLAFVIGGQWDE